MKKPCLLLMPALCALAGVASAQDVVVMRRAIAPPKPVTKAPTDPYAAPTTGCATLKTQTWAARPPGYTQVQIFSSNVSEKFTDMQARCNAYAAARPGVKGTCTVNNSGSTEVYWYAGQTLDAGSYGTWTAAARCNGQP